MHLYITLRYVALRCVTLRYATLPTHIIYIYMCVCVCMYDCVYVCIGLCLEMWLLHVNAGIAIKAMLRLRLSFLGVCVLFLHENFVVFIGHCFIVDMLYYT